MFNRQMVGVTLCPIEKERLQVGDINLILLSNIYKQTNGTELEVSTTDISMLPLCW